jgi:hypothetical protein
VLRASSIAALACPSNFKYDPTVESASSIPSRRLVTSLLGKTELGSRVTNVIMPQFLIHSIEWARSVNDIGKKMQMLNGIITNTSAPTLTFGSSDNPLELGTDDGKLVLVNTRTWERASKDPETDNYTWPSPVLRHETRWVIVTISPFDVDCANSDAVFGPLEGYYQHKMGRGCFIFAKLKYTAGVITSDSITVANGVLEAPANQTARQVVKADPLVDLAIAMVPEVLYYNKVSNPSVAPSWQNLNGYTCGMVATAYQASWNSLTNFFSGSTTTDHRTSVPVSVLHADLITWRVWLWLALKASLARSGLVLILMQRLCDTGVIQNSAVTALLLDSRAVIDQETSLCDAAGSLTTKNMSLRLVLRTSQQTDGYQHSRLILNHEKRNRGSNSSPSRAPYTRP